MLQTFSQLEQPGMTFTYFLHWFTGRLLESKEDHGDNWIMGMGIYAFKNFVCLSIVNFKISFLH